MRDKMSDKPTLERLEKLLNIAASALPLYEVRGVFRLIENTPAGEKVKYLEDKVTQKSLKDLYAGVFLVCPIGDKTNGRTMIEISTRDNTIFSKMGSSRDASILRDAYRKAEEYFEIVF